MAHLTSLTNQDRPNQDRSNHDRPALDRVRVLAADSTSMSTQLLVEALARDSQFQMIESPSHVAAILALMKRERPQVAVISAKLGEKGMGGFELVREIRSQSPGTRVIILLDVSDRAAVIESFRAGAQGVFCRTEPFRLLAKCIQCVHGGQVWASSSELQFVLEALVQPVFSCSNGSGISLLSARETDVVRCVAEGMTNREIAQRLKLTEHTVKNYLFRIFDKLGVSSRVEVVLYALGNGAVPRLVAESGRRQSQPVRVPARNSVSLPLSIRKTAT
jgi:two-component system nitrate/nitrite response regulator NarL